ncbi:MAG: glycosyltransferase family 39 protein, partial [Chloroflexota bacterium]
MNTREHAISPFHTEWALFFLALAIGAALRFYALGNLPHGIYHDEAYYGLDAVSVLNGAHPIFFTANNGREPLYIYLLSLSIAAFGRTPFGLRFASALIGTLTIPVTYLLGRVLFNRRVGLMAMFICAITFWPVALSRVSFRAGTLPLFLGLAIALGWLALQRRSLWLAVLGGAAYGLAFNTYTASRITPLAFALFAAIAFVFHRRDPRERGENKYNPAISVHSAVKILFVLFLAAALVVAPLATYAIVHPEQVFAREGQVSIFEVESGNPILILLKHIGLAAAMFGWRGDTIARHNLPGRPVFDAWTFVFFAVGIVVALMHARRARADPQAGADPRVCPYIFVLVWLAVTILPTVFAEDTPHFLRAIGALPVLWLLPAIGSEALIESRSLTGIKRPVRFIIVGVSLATSAILTAYDYFARYATDPVTGYYFESAATELADEIISRPTYAARMDNRLWDNFASLRFLIADRDGADSIDHILLAVWPYEPDEIRAAVAALPTGSQISAHRGALAQGDLEGTPYSLYTLYIAEPVRDKAVTARFGESVELRGAEVVTEGDSVRIRLRWAVSSPVRLDYHVYVHIIGDGEILAQADGEPLGGLYHFTWLRPGDVLNDEFILPRGESILVGLYAPDG